MSPSEGIAAQTVKSSQNLPVDLIIVQTANGKLPRYVAKYRPSVPIMAVSDEQMVVKQLAACRGIIGFKTNPESNDSLLVQALNHAKDN